VKKGDLNMALADCALSLLVEPENRRALQMRERLLNSTVFEVDDLSALSLSGTTETKLAPLPSEPRKPVPITPPKMVTVSPPASRGTKEPVVHSGPEIDLGGTAELTKAVAKKPKSTADKKASVGLYAAERESAAAPAALASTGLVVTETDTAEYEKEQRLLQEKLKREKTAEQARLEKQRQEEERQLLKVRQEFEEKQRSRKKNRRDGDDEGASPWIRRAAAAASVLVVIYMIGPSVWSYATSTSYPQDDEEGVRAEAKVTAAQLCKRFRDDSASAQAEFGDRVIEVTGIVKDVRKDATENTVIVLMDDTKEGRLDCKLAPTKSVSQGVQLSKVDKLGTVTLKGKCMSQDGKNMHLDDVRLIQVRAR
jgi:hypothetical protein